MAAVALMIIIIQILCVYIPTTAYAMIRADLDNKKIELAGSMDEIGTECVLVMRQLFEKNKETWGVLGAQGILVNLLMLTLDGSTDKINIKPEWKDKGTIQLEKIKDLMGDMKLDYQATIDKLAETSSGYPVTSEQLKSAMEKVSES